MRLPFLGRSKVEQVDEMAPKETPSSEVHDGQMFPPGHFYSPVPDLGDVRARQHEIFDRDRPLPGINLRESEQLALFRSIAPMAGDLPFTSQPSGDHRYWFDNGWFTYGDGVTYASLLRAFMPRRVIEIGSGFSSALLLDVNDCFCNGTIECVFIEPYPERLRSLLRAGDEASFRLIEKPVQNVGMSPFEGLESGDIVFIDSTHVAKTGSDVEWLFRGLMPTLPVGVLVHVHDIFHPFEYPAEWVLEGRGWNEIYVLRSFLQFNDAFDILLFPNFLTYKHRTVIAELCPKMLSDPGSSIWLRRSVRRRRELRQLIYPRRQMADSTNGTHDVASASALRDTTPVAACNELTRLDRPGRWVTVSEAGIDCSFWINAEPDVVQSVIEATRSFYEVDALRLLRQLLRPAPRIVDVGANIGNHSVFFARICGAQWVLPIEPNPEVLPELRANLAANRCSAADLTHLGVAAGAERGVLGIRLDGADRVIRNRGATRLVPDMGEDEPRIQVRAPRRDRGPSCRSSEDRRRRDGCCGAGRRQACCRDEPAANFCRGERRGDAGHLRLGVESGLSTHRCPCGLRGPYQHGSSPGDDRRRHGAGVRWKIQRRG